MLLRSKSILLVALVGLLLPISAFAQSSTSSAIVVTVTDQQGAAVAGASIEITVTATNRSVVQNSNADGQYLFAGIEPGIYTIVVKKAGFRTATVNGFKVDISKSYNLDVKLEVGELTQTVQVEAKVGAELQTTESTVGNVIPLGETPRLPALTRQVNELLLLQPGATPTGEVTGARSDQSTFTLDGIDVTNNSVGGTGTYMFLPIDAVEEFRVGVANPNASFGRGAGGQVSLLGRSGSNQYHGAGYWYHQNDNLNANTWDNNRLGIKKAELKDNRFGARAGGPVPFLWSNRLFFFANYEGRRFPSSSSVTRIVPSDLLKQGILQFRDSTGTVQQYNLATSTACGGSLCDPRGLGISPSMKALWALMPAGNNPSASAGDGLNTIGYTNNVSVPLTNDYYEARLDENISSKWRASESFRFFKQKQISSAQVDIIGGNVVTSRSLPVMQNMVVASLTGSITNSLAADFRFGWVRERDAVAPTRPNDVATLEAIAGTKTSAGFIALDAGDGGINGLLDEPFDVGTQVARKQSNDNRNFQWNADLIWSKGSHTFQFGSQVHYLPTRHLRDDKVIGALGALVAKLDSDVTGNFSIPAADRPAAIQSTDQQRWDRLYTATLGMIDSVTVLGVRDGQFNPLPFGSQLESDTRFWSPSFYFQDVWHIKPSLTITLGLNYEWQQAPTERLGRQTIQIDAGTGKPITAAEFFAARRAADASGTIFNPTFGFIPIKSAGGRQVFNVDWKDLGPRVGVAWNPSSTGFLSHLLGVRKTVVRAGFGIIFDRQNTVQSVIVPSLGVGFAQTLNVTAPACTVSGAAGAGCDATSTNPALSIFRVGVDGTLPVPTFPTQSNPVVPFWGVNSSGSVVKFPEVFSFQVDPNIKVGRNYALDLTIQRELPGNMLLEVGYVGRLGRDLPQSMSLGQSPYDFVDPTSKQTFAQAFDAVANALRAGQPAPTQPWFENQVPHLTTTTGTATIVTGQNQGANFINGNVGSIFSAIDSLRLAGGLQAFNNYLAQGIFLRSSTGTSNYHAMFATLNKRVSHGLMFSANYTLSRSMDEVGAIQNSAGLVPNSLNLFTEYGPSAFDFRHNFNTTFVYNLPFHTSLRGLNSVISGWFVSGIFTAVSGAPLIVTESSQVWGGTLQLGNNIGAVPTLWIGAFDGNVRPIAPGSTAASGVGTSGDPNNKGTGLSLFTDAAAVFKAFRPVNIATDGRSGRDNPVRGLGHWNMDTSIGKATKITERAQVVFSFDFFNMFNHPIFADPSLSLTNKAGFGVISSTFVPANRTQSSRWIQFSTRIEF